MDLNTWLCNNRSTVLPAIGIENTDSVHGQNSRGVVANQALTKGTTLAFIRHNQLLNPRSLTIKRYRYDDLSAQQLLAMYIYEKVQDQNNFYYPYLQSLPVPEAFEDWPVMWDADRLAKSLPSSGVQKIQNMWHQIARDQARVERCIREHNNQIDSKPGEPLAPEKDSPEKTFDSDLFRWAWLCVNSRCIYMKLDKTDNLNNLTLVPFVDMINHCNSGHDNVVLEFSGFGVSLTAVRDIAAGDELQFSYGSHDNCTLYCEYGFTLPKNLWATADVTVAVKSLLQDQDVQFLRSQKYYRDYSVSRTGLSFRTEVALACVVLGPESGVLQAVLLGQRDVATIRGLKIAVHTVLEAERKHLNGLVPENVDCERICHDYLEILSPKTLEYS